PDVGQHDTPPAPPCTACAAIQRNAVNLKPHLPRNPRNNAETPARPKTYSGHPSAQASPLGGGHALDDLCSNPFPCHSAASVAGAVLGSDLPLVVDDQWRVIGEAHFGVDLRALHPRHEAGREDLVVDAPADVLGPGLATVGPPRVLLGPLIDDAEAIDET